MEAGKDFLQRASGAPTVSNFDEVRMEAVEMPADSAFYGRTLADLSLSTAFGVQVAGINRSGMRMLNPSRVTPALLTRMSTRPKSSRILALTSCTRA